MPSSDPLVALVTGVFCNSLTLVASCLVNSLFRVKGIAANVLTLWILSSAQIVLLAELLSELRLISSVAFGVGQGTITLLAFIAWFLKGRPSIVPPALGTVVESLTLNWRKHPGLVFMGGAVLILTLANLAHPFFVPSANHDANAYHLPRAYFWWTTGTARHFPAQDFRQVEFPPNASFMMLWMMAASGSFLGLHLPQWVAGVVTSIATVGLARFIGWSRPPSLYAGLIFLTYPMVVLQLGSSQNDLITSAWTVSGTLFLLRAIRPGFSPYWKRDGGYAGIAWGLAIGAKLTVLFLMPGLLLAFLGTLLVGPTKRVRRRVAWLASCLVMGSVLFGAYNYVLNFADFGNPIASHTAIGSVYNARQDQLRKPLTNLFLYLYQCLDWPGFASDSEAFVVRTQRQVAQAVSDALDLDFEKEDLFSRIAGSARIDEDLSGYGPVGFLVLISSPGVFVVLIFRWKRRRAADVFFAACLVMMGITWLALFVVIQPWTPYKTRYFVLLMPLLSAVCLPPLLGKGWLRRVSAMVAGIVSLVVGTAVTVHGHDNHRLRNITDSPDRFGAMIAGEVALLRKSFPPGSRIGMALAGQSLCFPLMRYLPQLTFLPVAAEEISEGLDRGRIQGAVTGSLGYPGSGQLYPYFPRFYTHVRDQNSFLANNSVQYGLNIDERPGGQFVRFADVGFAFHSEGSRQISVPASLLDHLKGGLFLVLPLGPGSLAGEWTARCGDQQIKHKVLANGDLGLEIDNGVCATQNRLFADVHVSWDGVDPALDRLELEALPWGVSLGFLRNESDRNLQERLRQIVLPWRENSLMLGASAVVGVRETGFYGQENRNGYPARWTDGNAKLTVPLSAQDRLSAIRFSLVTFRDETTLGLLINNQPLFEGVIGDGSWSKEFSLSHLGLEAGDATIEIRSSTVKPPRDRRLLGVFIHEIRLSREREPGAR